MSLARVLDELGLTLDSLIRLFEDLLDQDLSAADTAELVDIGQCLWGLADTANQSLVTVKARLRVLALARGDGAPGPRRFAGRDGEETCLVTVPSRRVVLRKGTDIDRLRDLLGDQFDVYFDRKVKYAPRKDFQSRIVEMDDKALAAQLLDAVDVEDGTPRVSFPKRNKS